MKSRITVLWLDDVRDPVKYLKKKVTKDSGALYNNINFYNELMQKYDPEFTWVRTFEEFTDYIMQNGLPDLVSLDHDLGKGLKKGAECAHWLKQYCAENGLKLPKFYAHSANPNGRSEINATLSDKSGIVPLTEQDLRYMISSAVERLLQEDVFADRATIRGRKNKSINLTYQKHTGYNKGNLTSADMLSTDKMDANNEDTYKVMLKGGIMSYNITSIKGEAVMHYFKNYFETGRNDATIKANGTEYEIMMEDPEFRRFMNVFNNKVNRVVNYCIDEFKQENNEFAPNKVSIYPVPSSKQFNKKMAEIMSHMTLGNLPVRIANDAILKKDLRNLKRDEDFIEKNKDYFHKRMSQETDANGYDKSVLDFIDRDVNKRKAIKAAEKYIDEMNFAVDKVLSNWASYKHSQKPATLKTVAAYYAKYYDAMKRCTAEISYNNPTSEKEESSVLFKTVAKILSSSKPKCIEKRSGEIWEAIRPYMRGIKSPVTGAPYKSIDINRWEAQKFEIKNLSNGERMGMKNIYNPNTDPEFVENEINEIKGGVLVIFDDNISGGATLADVCYQFKDLGVEYIIPITFGEMATKWTMNRIPLNRPTNDEGEYGKFNY